MSNLLKLILVTSAIITAIVFVVALIPKLISSSATAATGQTDVLSVALRVAQAHGLQGEPTAMYITSGAYQSLQGSATDAAETVYDTNTVWLVQIQSDINFSGYGVRNKPMKYLYIYIDTVSGLPFQVTASPQQLSDFNGFAWQRVTKADIGKFPVVEYTSDTSGASSRPTATRAPNVTSTSCSRSSCP